MKVVHTIARLIIIAGLLLMLGSVGAVETETITLTRMAVQVAASVAIMFLGYAIGYFAGEETAE